jgi:hypothetical protein
MKKYLVDLADRTFWTYVQTASGLVMADQFNWLSLDSWQAAAVAAVPAALAVVKGGIAKFVNDPETATFLKSRVGRHS